MEYAAGDARGRKIDVKQLPTLPITPHLARLVEALRSHRAVVLEAPPGSGKTTQVPRALLDAGLADGGEIWVAEPRRVAARLAAHFVAAQLGGKPGEQVGYSVRFEECASEATRLKFVTEGVLLKRLTGPGGSKPLKVVVLDEFHERHVATDLCLMLLARTLATTADLRLVVMSATLNAEAIAAYLGNCPLIRCEGRSHPVSIRHQAAPDDRPLSSQVVSAVREMTRTCGDGNVLVFLPGLAEIRKAQASLSSFAQQQGLLVQPLYGDMPLQEQSRAIGATGQRRVILATNVAESSVTVDGVTAVVDSGLARIAEHSPWTGRQTLELRPVSRASAIQRAGRAGRTRPGHVMRLYSEADFKARREHERPEVLRLDLAEPLLQLYGADLAPTPADWLDLPSETSLSSAQQLLERLGLLNGTTLTGLGKRALSLPLHPRLSRLVLRGESLGIGERACLVAALLSEGDIRLRADVDTAAHELMGCDCDIEQLAELYQLAADERFSANAARRLGLHAGRLQAVKRSYRQLRTTLKRMSGRTPSASTGGEPPQHALSLALLSGFPDRVARRRNAGHRELVLASGQTAQLSDQSVARSAPLLVAVDATDHRSSHLGRQRSNRAGVVVHLATPIEPEWLLDLDTDVLEERHELRWDEGRKCVMESTQLCWGAVSLEQTQRVAPPGPETAAVLLRAALAQQASLFGKDDALETVLCRVELLHEHLPELGLDALRDTTAEQLLTEACQDAASLEALKSIDFPGLALARLSHAQQAALRQDTPERAVLLGGRQVRIRYVRGLAPSIESRLQDFFGMTEGPRICRGRVPLTLHLLAPNRRAVQVTTDLAGFWERHYPQLRRQLCRRYPRHAWPEDGRHPTR